MSTTAIIGSAGIDTLILGCTHYPYLTPVIEKVVGHQVTLIDSGSETAHILTNLLQEKKMMAEDSSEGRLTVLMTDLPRRFREVGMRFLGQPLDDIGLVSLAHD